jgi:hypothetical protein
VAAPASLLAASQRQGTLRGLSWCRLSIASICPADDVQALREQITRSSLQHEPRRHFHVEDEVSLLWCQLDRRRCACWSPDRVLSAATFNWSYDSRGWTAMVARWEQRGTLYQLGICGSKRKEKMTLSPCPLVQMGDALLGQLARVLVLLAVQLAPAMAKSISWDYSDEEMGPLVPVRASRSSRTLDTKPFDGVLGPCRNGAASPTPTSSTGARAELISPSNKETNPGVVEGKSL